ncbi:MAG: hypothetical protein Q9220_006556 [cf. Caloplaca sp. 1 TL-2023]
MAVTRSNGEKKKPSDDTKAQKSSSSARKSPTPEKKPLSTPQPKPSKSAPKPKGVQRTSPKSKQPKVWRHTDGITFHPSAPVRPYPTPSPTPSHKWDSKVKMSVNEQLTQARDFLRSEDPDTNPDFRDHYTAIQTMMSGLASAKEMFDVKIYNDVKAKLRVHGERMRERELEAAARLPPPAGSTAARSTSTFRVPSASSGSASTKSDGRPRVFTDDLPYSGDRTTPETVATSRNSQEEKQLENPGTKKGGPWWEDEDKDYLRFTRNETDIAKEQIALDAAAAERPRLPPIFDRKKYLDDLRTGKRKPWWEDEDEDFARFARNEIDMAKRQIALNAALGERARLPPSFDPKKHLDTERPRLVPGFDPEKGFIKRWVLGDKILHSESAKGAIEEDSAPTRKTQLKADKGMRSPPKKQGSGANKQGTVTQGKRPMEDIAEQDAASKRPKKQLAPVEDIIYVPYLSYLQDSASITDDSYEEQQLEDLRSSVKPSTAATSLPKSSETAPKPPTSKTRNGGKATTLTPPPTTTANENFGAQVSSDIPGEFWPGEPFFMFGETMFLNALKSQQIEVDLAYDDTKTEAENKKTKEEIEKRPLHGMYNRFRLEGMWEKAEEKEREKKEEEKEKEKEVEEEKVVEEKEVLVEEEQEDEEDEEEEEEGQEEEGERIEEEEDPESETVKKDDEEKQEKVNKPVNKAGKGNKKAKELKRKRSEDDDETEDIERDNKRKSS